MLPKHLWCRLLPQATQTLNLLHQSWKNPRLSAEAQLNKALYFNQTPMSPQGKNSSSTIHHSRGENGTYMARKGGTSTWTHSTTYATASMLWRYRESAHQKQYSSLLTTATCPQCPLPTRSQTQLGTSPTPLLTPHRPNPSIVLAPRPWTPSENYLKFLRIPEHPHKSPPHTQVSPVQQHCYPRCRSEMYPMHLRGFRP